MRFALCGNLLRERPCSLTLGSESRRPTLRDEATLRNASLLVLSVAGCSLMNQAHSLFNLEGIGPMAITYPCGRDGIMAVLPHRDPFLWLTRVVECVPGEHIVAELDVDPA